MIDLLPFNFFPEGGLTSSVVVTVWVGIWVVCFLNLRFGLALSGLVVPGYLVPLLLVKPISAGVILLEGLVTYFITLGLAGGLMRRLGASEMFGRDRFFALVLVSIVVRVIFDGWLLPSVGQLLNESGLEFDHRNNLQSFGLIIISLVANQMWNGGVRRGLTSLMLYLGLTFLFVKFVMIPLTNYSISNLSFIYEDMASSILATPKAYIILLTTAYIASKMNLRYGWEFNGILIPSLLALQWYEPSKLLVTFIEAFIILWLGKLCLQLPFFTRLNMEGARLLLLFFNISFLYKYVLSFILISWAPALKVSDYFAFGYLLSTLLALKMFQKDIPVLITRATLQTSAFALIVASVVGFALSFIQPSLTTDISSKNTTADAQEEQRSLEALVVESYSDFYRSRTQSFTPPTVVELANYEQAMNTLAHLLRTEQALALSELQQHPVVAKVQAQLQQIQFDLQVVPPGYVIIKDTLPARAGGMVVLNPANPDGLTVEVPAPLNETGIADLALRLFMSQQAKALIYAGSFRQQDPQRRSDMLVMPRSFFQIAHEQLGDRNILQLRAFTRTTARELTGQRFSDAFLEDSSLPNYLWIKQSLPPSLDLSVLHTSINNLDVSWRSPVFTNRQRDFSREGFAELMLTRSGIRQLIAALAPLPAADETREGAENVFTLTSWLSDHKQSWASKRSELYQPARLDELIFFDEQVISPLLNLLDSAAHIDDNTLQQEQQRIDLMAKAFGYQLVAFRQPDSARHYLLLYELPDNKRRYWGTYVFTLGEAKNYLVEVPRPLAEMSSFEFSIELFEQLNARALLVPSSHAWANEDGSANVLQAGNTLTLFNLVHQTLLRHYAEDALMVLQVRGQASSEQAPANAVDIRLAPWQDSSGLARSESLQQLVAQLGEKGLSVDIVSGAQDEAGYEAHYGLLSRYLPVTRNADMATLWVSKDLRRRMTQRSDQKPFEAQFRALNIALQAHDLRRWLSEMPHSKIRDPERLMLKVSRFIANGDIVLLADIMASMENLHLSYVLDKDSQQYFMVLMDDRNAWISMANLNPLKPEERVSWKDAASFDDFLQRRSGWLLRGLN